MNRLTGASGVYNKTYSYNAAGNITYSDEGGGAYSYDPVKVHQMTSTFVGNSYGYDAVGNMTSRYVNGTSYSLSYDQENRLSGVSGGASATMWYDGDGKRVKATVNGVTSLYIGDYYEVAGGVVKKYYYLGGVRVAMREGTSDPTYLLTDHLGSTALNVSAGLVKDGEVRYYAWGSDRYTSGSMPTTYRYTGQRAEQGIGLYYYGARYYDASLRRFVQADTIVPEPGNPQSLNRYTYVNNNPVKYRNPSGHWLETAWDIANVLWDIHEVKHDPSLMNIAALVVDAGSVVLPLVPAGLGMVLRGGKAADKALEATKAVSKADKLGDAAQAARRLGKEALQEATGQMYHLLSEKITRELGRHKTLKGMFDRTDSRLIFQAKDKAAHRGYETWHRQVDDEVAKWLQNPKYAEATLEEFLKFLQDLYQRPDIKAHIPNVDLTALIQEVGQ